MKINKYITIAIVLVTMVSCVDDDFSRKYVDDEVKKNTQFYFMRCVLVNR